jgi:hypothetical protein
MRDVLGQAIYSPVTRALVARAYPRLSPDAVEAPRRVGPRIKSADDGWRRVIRRAARLLVVAAPIFAAPVIARADEPPLSADQMALANQLVDAIGIQQVADAAMGGLRLVLVQSLAARNKQPPDKVAAIVDAVLVPDLRALEPQFIAKVADSYGQAFTGPEMAAILAFYQTPAGMKLQQLTPGLTQQMVASGHAWIVQAATQVLQADAAKLNAQGLNTQ